MLDVFRVVHDLFSRIPFNQLLGLEIEELTHDHACVSFPMRDELVPVATCTYLVG